MTEEVGFEGVIVRASVAELMLLGDAARLAPKQGRAVQAYKAVRTRFPGTAEAQRAAFTLGRISLSQGSYSGAARWFKACLNDNRSGNLAREASGRLIESLDKAGDSAGARKAAEDYLAHFASGPHTKLAKKILAKEYEN
jgi:TolA-binding protein